MTANLAPSTRPIPLQNNDYTFTENVRETAILAVSFAEDFERLLELYKISEYDIFVRSSMFTLHHTKKLQQESISEPSKINAAQQHTAESIENFVFDMES